jgi:fatty acid amide hydrolase
VAAGGATLGLGTDIGGSVRSPAASCGVVGFLPTAGRLPDPGRLSEPIGQLAVQSQVGPIARDVDDAALALRVANGGPAPEDGHPRPLADHAGVRLAGLRVGVWLDDGVLAPGPAPRRAVARASAALERAGVTVVPFAGPDVADALGLYVALMSADGFRHARRVLGKDPRDRRIRLMELGHGGGVKMPVLRALLRLSGRKKTAAVLERFDDLSADRYFQLVEAQLDARAAWLAALDGAEGGPLDALVSPAQPVPAVLHGATAELGAMGGYYVLYNLLGWPAGVVPVTRVRRDEQAATPARGRDVMERVAAACEAGSAGLPVGVQVAARPWRDHVALALMRAIEADARASGEHPGLPILRS